MEDIKLENEQAKWYVLHTISGYENVAKDNLTRVVEKNNLQNRIFDMVIPMEEVIVEKNGKKTVKQQKTMPSYLIVKMIYADDIWHTVTRTRGITGFVGPKGRPLPITDEEVAKLRLEVVSVKNDNLKPGDKVEVLDGAIAGFVGVVNNVNADLNQINITAIMFGRETKVDVALDKVRKIS